MRRSGCAAGGVPDARLVGDVAGAAEYLRGLNGVNGRIGVIGYCSGGRHTFLAACSLPLDAAVDCYGAFVVDDPPPEMPKHMQPIPAGGDDRRLAPDPARVALELTEETALALAEAIQLTSPTW
jgi:dienelactone hydrolase